MPAPWPLLRLGDSRGTPGWPLPGAADAPQAPTAPVSLGCLPDGLNSSQILQWRRFTGTHSAPKACNKAYPHTQGTQTPKLPSNVEG